MRSALLISCLVSISLYSCAQQDSVTQKKRIQVGFLTGIDYNFLQTPLRIPDTVSTANRPGLRLGIQTHYAFNDVWGLAPKAEVAFGNTQVIRSNGTRSVTSWKVFPTSLDVRLHVRVKGKQKNWRPYLQTGPSVKIPLKAHVNLQRSQRYDSGASFGADFAVGFEKELKHVRFAPELRHSMGLTNISQTNGVRHLYLHTVSLVLNFSPL